MKLSDFTTRSGEWLRGMGPHSEVVISSRIRLARNVSGERFCSRLDRARRAELEKRIRLAILAAELAPSMLYADLTQSVELERQLLVERHLISKPHAASEDPRGVAVSGDEQISIMVLEEDHLRIQVLRSGLQLDEAWEQISAVDDKLDDSLEFAFSKRLGYLTACPTNVGTGIRVSVMLHLPALKLTGDIEKVFRAAKDLKLAVRGLYGEGTEATGDFYQVSNQVTLGKVEEDIISDFRHTIIPRIVEFEQMARRTLLNERTPFLDDKVHRAIGLLRSARILTSEEVLFLLSHVRLGANLGRLRDIDVGLINELFLNTQQSHLQKVLGKRLDTEPRRVARAEYVRKKLGAAD
jgi:protein arginine kinase